MNTHTEKFSLLEEISLKNIKGDISISNLNDTYDTSLIFSSIKPSTNIKIPTDCLCYFFTRMMNISINNGLNENFILVSQSIKYPESTQLNELLISKTRITKKTTNLIFSSSKLYCKDLKIISFSNAIWKKE